MRLRIRLWVARDMIFEIVQVAIQSAEEGCEGEFDNNCSDPDYEHPVADWCDKCLLAALIDEVQRLSPNNW